MEVKSFKEFLTERKDKIKPLLDLQSALNKKGVRTKVEYDKSVEGSSPELVFLKEPNLFVTFGELPGAEDKFNLFYYGDEHWNEETVEETIEYVATHFNL